MITQVTNFVDDDETFQFFDDTDNLVFGFNLLDSDVSNGEPLLVYDQKGQLLSEFDLPLGPAGIMNNFFWGVWKQTSIRTGLSHVEGC